MADPSKPLVLFISSGDNAFDQQVRGVLDRYYTVQEVAGPSIENPSYHKVIAAFSQSVPSPSTFDQIPNFPPDSVLVVTNGPVPQPPADMSRVSTSAIIPISRLEELIQRPGLVIGAGSDILVPARGGKSAGHYVLRSKRFVRPSETLSIMCDPMLAPETVTSALTALANYYRACGGVGLSLEFESQEAVTEEVHV